MGDTETLMEMGIAKAEAGDFAGAGHCFLSVIRAEPRNARALRNMANVLRNSGLAAHALPYYRRAWALDEDPDIGLGLATCLIHLDCPNEGVRILGYLPLDRPDVHYAMGLGFIDTRQYDEAIDAFDQAIALGYDTPGIRFDRSLVLLTLGRYDEGWPDYEARLQCRPQYQNNIPLPKWDGAIGSVRRLWVYSDQGLGDAIQAWRYIEPLSHLIEVEVHVQPELLPLLTANAGAARVLPRGAPMPMADAHCPLMSLPGLLGARQGTISGEAYLRVPAVPGLGSLGSAGRLKVGLVWAGDPTHPFNRRRSIPLEAFYPILGEDLTVYSFQKGPAAMEISARGLTGILTDLSPFLRDMASTAWLLREVDVLVTVDTAMAHLAGALGIPCLVLLPFSADWRWGTSDEETPWYRSLWLLQQDQMGEWILLVERVRRALLAIGPKA